MDTMEILTALGTPAGRADPYPLYAALHEVGEVIELGPGDVLVVGYDAINSVLRDPGFRVSDESSLDKDFPGWRANPVFVQVADWILNLNAPRHSRIRTLSCLRARLWVQSLRASRTTSLLEAYSPVSTASRMRVTISGGRAMLIFSIDDDMIEARVRIIPTGSDYYQRLCGRAGDW